jgi:hypothetical protein
VRVWNRYWLVCSTQGRGEKEGCEVKDLGRGEGRALVMCANVTCYLSTHQLNMGGVSTRLQ